MLRLLMTRPMAGSRRFVQALPPELLAQMEVIYAPLMRIEPVSFDSDLSGHAAVVFTSSHGVLTLSEATEQRLPALCVGARTADLARSAGWRVDCIGQNADDLVKLAHDLPMRGRLIHIRGKYTQGDLAGGLSGMGLTTDQRVVYDQRLLPFAPEVQEVLRADRPILAPVFSRRTARQFADQASETRNLYFIALSMGVAEPLKSLNYKELQISKAPDTQSMIDLLRYVASGIVRVEGTQRGR